MINQHMKRCLISSVIRETQIPTSGRYPFTPPAWLEPQRQTLTSATREWRKGDPHTLLLALSGEAAALETGLAFSQMVKDGIIVRSSNSSPRYIYVPKRHENICPHKTCTIIFIATLFILANMNNQNKPDVYQLTGG